MQVALRATLATMLAAVPCLNLTRPAAARGPARCSVDLSGVPRRPAKFEAIVVRVISPERARASTEAVETSTGARISPDYADLPRVVAKVVLAQRTFETVAAVVDGHIPQPGEHVGLLSRYIDPRSPCDFIPWTIRGLDAMS